MKVKVEFESTPIRHIAIQCPKCERWFYGRDVTTDDLHFDYQIEFAHCTCPVCSHIFSGRIYDSPYGVEIEEVGSAEECYDGCMKKKAVWE